MLAQAFLEEGDDALVVAMAKASLIYTSKDGLVAVQGGAPVDPLMAGEAVWRAAQISDDPALRKAADDMLDWTLKRAPRAADGTIFHTGQTIWSDSFHTSPPFLAYAGHYAEAIQQIEGHRKRLWDPEKKLLSHRWDESRQQFGRKAFWGGLFYDIVDDPNSYVETNLAQMLAFSIYESVRGGWLTADYLKAADRMRAAARAKVDRDGFVHGVAGAPTFSQPGVSPEGQAFFLMMEAAYGKLVKSGKSLK